MSTIITTSPAVTRRPSHPTRGSVSYGARRAFPPFIGIEAAITMENDRPHLWLNRVPRDAGGLATWLDEGRPLYPDALTMGNAIKDASRDAQFSDLTRAEWLGRGLILFGEQEKAESLIGLGEIALGDALRLQDHTLEGLALLDRAAERFERAGDEVGWARTRIGWLGNVHRMAEHPPVEPVVERALAILQRKAEVKYLLPLFQNYAHYCIMLGRLADALPLCEQALAIAEAIEDAEARYAPLLSVLAVMIQAHCEVGHYRDAESLVQSGMALLAPRSEYDNNAADFLNTASILYLRTGRYSQALYTLEQARQSTTRSDILATLEWRTAQANLYLNRLAESEARVQKSLEALHHTPENDMFRATFMYLLAEVYRLSGRWQEGLEISSGALDLMLDRSNPSLSWINVMYRQYAWLLKQGGESEMAENAIATALSLADAVGEHVEQIHTRLLASEILSDPAASWRALDEANEMAWSLPWVRWRVNQTIARLTEDPAMRRSALVRATDDLDTVQSSLAASFHADYLTEAQKLYDALIGEYLAAGEIEAGWKTVERAKSRALVNTLMAHQEAASPVDSPRLAQLKALQLRHFELTRQVAEGRLSHGDAGLREVEAEIARVREGIEIEQLGRREPLGVPAPFVPSAPCDSDLVGYYVANDAVHIFVHDGENYRHARAETSPAELHGILVAMATNGAATANAPDTLVPILRRQYQNCLHALYRHLIEPVRPFLRHEKLTIVPYGLLHQLPFHLLWDGEAYLLEAYEIRIVPTARLLQQGRGARPAGLRHGVISHDWEGRLPSVAREGAVVAELLGAAVHLHGVQAKKESVLELLDSRGVLHIAAHGAHRTDNPELSHVQLDDGQLTLVDLFSHVIHKDLITLCACETGLAVIRAGDDPVGLWRGFLAAGARSLLVALWQLEDSISEQLMTHYYDRLAQGAARAGALREVQLDWLRQASGRYLHPFYWGAYQLIGDDGPVLIHANTEEETL